MAVRALSDDEVLALRTRAQRFTGARGGGSAPDVAEVVAAVVGVQAQAVAPARLGVRVRSTGLTVAAVVQACAVERSVVRTWTLRGTLHLVGADDIGWLVGLLGPASAARDARRRTELGLDDGLVERALHALPDVLAGGALTRAELVRALAASGVAVPADGQAPAHLVAYAAMHGLLCYGPDREDGEPTFVLLASWLGRTAPPMAPDEALANLARRYLAGHGPAGATDLAAWAGIPLGRARRGLELVRGELEEVRVGRDPAWLPAGAAAEAPDAPGRGAEAGCGGPVVRLLPAFDGYLLGYRTRAAILAPAWARRVHPGGGWINPTLLVDGRIAGTWRQQRGGSALTVVVAPFARLDAAVLPGLEAEVADVGRFLGAPTRLVVAE